MPQLKPEDIVRFNRFHVIDYQWKDKDKEHQFPKVKSIQQWDRCLVDSCILERGIPVSFLYKEEPDMAGEDDKYPDSGWRIRGDTELMTDDEYDNDQPTYIALGKVLNVDDSWVHLINEPIGSRFFKNKVTGEFERE